MTHLWNSRTGRLSFQVLQEFYITVTQKLDPGLDTKDARDDVRLLLSWEPIAVTGRVIELAWAIQDQHQLSWWDSLIIAAARLGNCRYVLTEDLQENQRIENIVVVNPFNTPPGAHPDTPLRE